MRKALDITGKKFGKLIVLGKGTNPLKWICQCTCGNVKEVYKKSLTRGSTTSCGIPHFVDLSTRVFGNWTVTEFVEKRTEPSVYIWKCQCKCGMIRNVIGASLTGGHSNSCGNFQCRIGFQDLTNQRFGKLIVLEIQRKIHKGTEKTYWKCQCDCGNTKIIYNTSLIRGDTRSCGCLINDNKKESIKNQAWASHLANCNIRKIANFLSKRQYLALAELPCYYCEGFHIRHSGGKTNVNLNLNGLDRINHDKSIGYSIFNVLPCCIRCNKVRNNYFTVEETKIAISAVLDFRKNQVKTIT